MLGRAVRDASVLAAPHHRTPAKQESTHRHPGVRGLPQQSTSWLSFREFNGLLVYYTHLVSYRCAIREVRIGIDTAVPNQVLKMPGCDMRDPSAISAGMPLYMKLAPATQFISVELTYRDGSVSEIKSFRSANRSNN